MNTRLISRSVNETGDELRKDKSSFSQQYRNGKLNYLQPRCFDHLDQNLDDISMMRYLRNSLKNGAQLLFTNVKSNDNERLLAKLMGPKQHDNLVVEIAKARSGSLEKVRFDVPVPCRMPNEIVEQIKNPLRRVTRTGSSAVRPHCANLVTKVARTSHF